jgi:hypothetical protein
LPPSQLKCQDVREKAGGRVRVDEDDRQMHLGTAKLDLRALGVVALVLSGLALVCAGSLWYNTWTLGYPDSNWLDTFGDWAGDFAPVLAGFGMWLWWFAHRIAREHGLQARLANLAVVVCVVAASVWIIWLVVALTGHSDVV